MDGDPLGSSMVAALDAIPVLTYESSTLAYTVEQKNGERAWSQATFAVSGRGSLIQLFFDRLFRSSCSERSPQSIRTFSARLVVGRGHPVVPYHGIA